MALAFAGGVGLGLHGYSLPIWHQLIDGSPMTEVLLGEPRAIRSDDWAVGLPLALAQRAHEPPYPRVNENIGLGQPMLLVELPVAHPATLLRPTTWGFFLGATTGVAWMWWSQVLGFVAAWFLALRVIARGRTLPAALGALVLGVSPFLQFWAFAPGRVSTYAALSLAAFAALLDAQRLGAALAWGALLGWSLGCFALVLYPPFQIPLAWWGVAAGGGLLIERARNHAPRTARGCRASGFALAAAILLAGTASFAVAAAPAIERMLGTAYPGARSFTGGGLSLARLFAHDLGPGLFVSDWSAWLNIGESAGFWLCFPVTALAVGAAARQRRVDPLALALLGCIALLGFHAVVGWPGWLTRATLLDQVQPERALLGIGLADAALLLRVLTDPERRPLSPALASAGALAFGAGLLLAVPSLRESLPELPLAGALGFAAFDAALAFAVLRALPAAPILAALAALLAATTLWFNPLVRGGVDYLVENPLSQRILEIDREAGGDTTWLTYGSPFTSNLFRMIGVHSVNGVYPLPQLELWRRLDPEGHFESVYNRMAHVRAVSGRTPGVRFELGGPDAVDLIVDPGAPELATLGVTHVLIVAPDPSGPDAMPGIERIASIAWNHLYRVLPRAPRAGTGPRS